MIFKSPEKSSFLTGFLQGLTAPALLFRRPAAFFPLPATPLAANGLLGASFIAAYQAIVREHLP
jgi:hypothetical protein